MMQKVKDQIIRALFKAYGIILIFGFFVLFHLILYSFIYDTTLLFYIEYEDKWISIVILIFGLIEGFNIIFNYCLTILVSPGDTSQWFGKSEIITESDQDNLQIESTIQTYKICHICQKPKPLRVHHCRICNVCILKMDHHCPWFGNCIGYQNQRYFLLLLTHLVIGTFYISLLNIFIIYNSNFSKYSHLQSKAFQVVWLLDIILLVILIAFSSWSWFLALNGYTTIEFLARNKKQIKLQNNKEQNLQIIFGKVEHWSEILLPSTRDLPSYAFILSNYLKQQQNHSFQNDDEQPLIDKEI